jgi:hypothetical protein
MALVTMDQARRHLNIPASGAPPVSEHDTDIAEKQEEAEALILGYVRRRMGADASAAWLAEVATWDVTAVPAVTPPAQVRAAVLRMLGDLWRYRGDDLENERPPIEPGELPRHVTTLLDQLCDPAFA